MWIIGRTCAWMGLAVVLAACASPDTAKIAALGEAAKKSVVLVGEAKATGEVVSNALGDEAALLAYVGKSGRVTLDPAPQCVDPTFWTKTWLERTETAKALADYVTALSKATDPDAALKIDGAATALAGVVAPGAAAVAPVAQQAGQAIINLQIRAVMAQTDPYVEKAVENLKKDIGQLASVYKECLSEWAHNRTTVLLIARRSGANPEFYVNSIEQRRALATRIKALEEAPAILNAFREAHRELLENRLDIKALKKQFDDIDKLIGLSNS